MDEMGEIFNPQIHEAISTTEDDMLDEGTITKVIRKDIFYMIMLFVRR